MAENKDTTKKSETSTKKQALPEQDSPKQDHPTVEEKVTEKSDSRIEVAEQYSIFETGGKQYQAVKGQTLAIEKIEGEPGQKVEFKEVLLKKTGDGNFEIGRPYVEGATVKASIVKHDKAPKVIIFKFQRRKKTRVKKGHRQPLTVIRFEAV